MILVTGGTGLVGAHLLLHLIQEGESCVRAIYRDTQQIEKTRSLFAWYQKESLFDRIDWMVGDITDIPSLEIAFEKVTHVYHCAAQISFNPNEESALRKINIEGTANIVNVCIDKNIQKLCHVSSIAALGDPLQNQTVIDEETEWNPEVLHSDYALTKYGAEMEVWRGQQEGLQVVIVNPGIILGPYPLNWDARKGSGSLFTSLKKGLPFYTQGFSAYISVQDVVILIKKIMEAPIHGERFALVAENRSFKDIQFTIADKLGVKRPGFEAKPWMLALGWRLDKLLSFLSGRPRKLSRQSAASLCSPELISNEKVKRTFAYTFQPIDAYIDQIIQAFR
ncbi:NAD-dependent epimerase/dehydratase family protein [Flavobacterium sp.]|jgi:dihydroflavonol-4-reductase|uniref:NAD-dependent epimerase/dehydratase family protein n=1 Tax=Flavobacterium sp. TaxID=239 RepID=UPI0022BBD3F6|nr:NAD-dependent epimerase/dehydratase family protein [Flavobacterium sp.]MCZ8144766.1 NAD-dependent epimerase/dehydratase family protein [Flavobacterium sp.]MCZ8367121.1 NAD-dependent epimerase/dehydratase family protein [Flavobacterium sp.]